MAYAQLESASTYLTCKEAAQFLSVHPRTVYDLIVHGRLEAIDISPDPNSRRRTYRIAQAKLEEFLRGSTTKRLPPTRKPGRKNAPSVRPVVPIGAPPTPANDND